MLHGVSLSPSLSLKSTQKYFICELGFNLHSTANDPVQAGQYRANRQGETNTNIVTGL